MRIQRYDPPELPPDPPDMEKLADLEHVARVSLIDAMLQGMAIDTDEALAADTAPWDPGYQKARALLRKEFFETLEAAPTIKRWRRLSVLDYSELTEEEKEECRERVRYRLSAYRNG